MRQSSLHQVVIILLFISCVVYGQEQIRKAGNKNGNKQQTNTLNAARTQNSNLPVNEPSKTVVKSDENKNQTDWARSSAQAAWYQAIASIVQAVAGVIVLGLIVWQALQIQRQGGDVKKNLTQITKQAKTMEDALEETRKAVKASERQAQTAEDSIKLTRESFRLSQRAYVSCKEWGMRSLKPLEAPSFLLTFINNGDTPAYEFYYDFGLDIYAEASKVFNCGYSPISSEKGESMINIPPNTEYKVDTTHSLCNLTEKQVAMIKSGEQSMCITCYIFYKDLQRESCSERFCFEYDPKTSQFALLTFPPSDCNSIQLELFS